MDSAKKQCKKKRNNTREYILNILNIYLYLNIGKNKIKIRNKIRSKMCNAVYRGLNK